MVQEWCRSGAGVVQEWYRSGAGVVQEWYGGRLVGEASRAALLCREYCDGRIGGGGVRGRDGACALDADGVEQAPCCVMHNA